MKKKSLLGILAVLMVFALALTGCGQQGEQNAGATGSESQNGTTAVDDVKNEGEVTTEPEVNIGEKPDGSDVVKLLHWYHDRDAAYIKTVEKDSDGYYHYKVGDKELLCKTNVWDFIEAKEGLRGTYYVWRFEDMAESIGLYPSDFAATHHMGARVDPNQSRLDFALDLGSNHETPYGKTAITMTGMMNCYKFEEMIYCLSSDTSYQVSLEQVCYSAYEMEQLELGRTQNEIMDNDFVDWQVLEGHAIP
ncbi:MAG TPA: hypothetical protein H9886_02625 [Candidatus Faecalicoccus intestinipullorum]|nr:hypothetical protein [Candidatus Faecalicoccus intestinipullorum]